MELIPSACHPIYPCTPVRLMPRMMWRWKSREMMIGGTAAIAVGIPGRSHADHPTIALTVLYEPVALRAVMYTVVR